ncbi:MAG: SagB/ThcOx family dehydrogenase [Bacteroidales bacterium]
MANGWIKYLLIVLFLLAIVISSAYLWRSSADNNKKAVAMKENGTIELPTPVTSGGISVEKAIAQRRSVRIFTEDPVSASALSQLLWSAQGITDKESGKRAAPSAGLTLPMEVYVAVGSDVDALQAGIYHYKPGEHELRQHKSGDLRAALSEAALGQTCVKQAPLSIVLAAVYERTTDRYSDHGRRYVHMEAGHIAQNLYLQCESLDLSTVVVGAFSEEQVQEILDLPDDQEPLYIVPVGTAGE